MIKKIIIIYCILLSINSCKKESDLIVIDNISLENWNKETIHHIYNVCKIENDRYKIPILFGEKEIYSSKEYLEEILKKRKKFLSKLKSSKISEKVNDIVIVEFFHISNTVVGIKSGFEVFVKYEKNKFLFSEGQNSEFNYKSIVESDFYESNLKDSLSCLNELKKGAAITNFSTKTIIENNNGQISYSAEYIYLGE